MRSRIPQVLEPGRQRAHSPQHLRAAVKWLFHMIADCSRLAVPSDVLLMEDLDTSHDEGRKLKDAALHILEQLKAETLRSNQPGTDSHFSGYLHAGLPER